jgi:hypothetical protein
MKQGDEMIIYVGLKKILDGVNHVVEDKEGK